MNSCESSFDEEMEMNSVAMNDDTRSMMFGVTVFVL